MPKRTILQGKKMRMRGFTLVEIMIVILIMVLLIQFGNIAGLFRIQQKNILEQVAIDVISGIDAQKTHALLGRTEDGNIVRERRVNVRTRNEEHMLLVSAEVNLAKDPETNFIAPVRQKNEPIMLKGMKAFFYDCSQTLGVLLTTPTVTLQFKNEATEFHIPDMTRTDLPYHLVLLLTLTNTSHEIHIDRRTGLTYEKYGKGKDTNGNWIISCN